MQSDTQNEFTFYPGLMISKFIQKNTLAVLALLYELLPDNKKKKVILLLSMMGDAVA
jgi:hypothetical protein